MSTSDADLIAAGDEYIENPESDATAEEVVESLAEVEEKVESDSEVDELSDADDSNEDPEGDSEFNDEEQDDEQDDENDTQDDVTEADDVYEVKVNGKVLKLTKAELLKGYSTGKASQSKFDEASAVRQQAEMALQNMKDDPMSALQALGIDVRQLSEHYLASQIDLDNMTDEQYENYQMKQQLEQMRLDNDRREQEDIVQQTNAARDDYVTRINSALTEVELPVNELTTRRMAYYMQEALKSEDPDIRNISDKEVAELVEEDYANELRGYSDDKLTKMLGEEKVQKVKTPKLKQKSRKPVKGVVKKAVKNKMNSDQWNDYLDNLS